MVPAQRKTTSLVSLKDEAKAMKDESKAVKDEAERMANSNKMLQQRFSTGVCVDNCLPPEARCFINCFLIFLLLFSVAAG